MCGFLCVFDRTGNLENFSQQLQDAGQLLQHRGPDDTGFFADEHFGVYFTRLSIIDVSTSGHQPMFSDDGNLVLAFNGEIYNYKELRKILLDKGCSFQTTSDTEVLLKAYQEFGETFIDRLRGMFSFVIWDCKKKELKVFRDRLGIKPLFYYDNGSQIIFSSEIKAILKYAPESKRVDEKTLFKYLARGWVDDSVDTFFQKIKNVSPAHYINVSASGLKRIQYWKLEPKGNKLFNKEEFLSVFDETISFHLRSDAPLAFTLSGGMDSSSLVASAVEKMDDPKQIRAFSVIPPETVDESCWIDEIARKTKINHEYLDLDFSRIKDSFDDVLSANDEPFHSSSCLYQYLLRKAISEFGIKVLLVGEGGDEVLGGYRRFLYPYLLSLKKDAKWDEFNKTVSSANLFMGISQKHILGNVEQFRVMVESRKSGQENQSAYDLISNDYINANQEIVHAQHYPMDLDKYGNYLFSQLAVHLFLRDLPHVLRMEDRNSMAHGIEARVPFLDHKFLEFVFSHDYVEFMKKSRNKSMLRRSMVSRLPNSVVGRKSKSPRPGNDSHLLYDCLSDRIQEILSSRKFKSLPYLGKNCLKMFEEDKKYRNIKRAEGWFRIYSFSRWLDLI